MRTLPLLLSLCLTVAVAEPGLELHPEVSGRSLPPVPAGAELLRESVKEAELSGTPDERTDFFFVEGLGEDEIGFAVDSEHGWIEYRVKEDRLILNVNARVAYNEMRLSADTVVYENETGEVLALGAPMLLDGEERVDGDEMRYNFNSERGLVYRGGTSLEDGFAFGERFKLQKDDVIHIQGGTFTTSDRPDDPEYHFYCPEMKVYTGDKVIARPIVLYVGKVPVAVAPYYYYPLGRERRSGFLAPRFSYKASEQFTIRNAYFWAINDFADATFALDYDTAQGWRQEIEGRYLFGTERGFNYFRAIHDEDRSRGEEWWSLTSRHEQDLPGDVRGMLRLDLRTDRFYDYLYSEDVEERTKSKLQSFLSFSRSWEKVSLNLDFQYTDTLVDDFTQGDNIQIDDSVGYVGPSTWTLPRFRASLSQTELFESGLFLSASTSFLNRLREGEVPYRNAGADLHLSRPFNLFRWFKFSPYADGSIDWYRNAADGSLNYVQPLYHGGISGSTRLYGIFDDGADEWRHIIEPSARLSWYPEIDNDNAPEGSSGQQASTVIAPSLTNRLKIRFASPDDEQDPTATSGGTLELLRWSLSSSYLINGENRDETPWEDLSSRLYVYPNFTDWYDSQLSLTTRHDLYSGEMERLDFTANLAFSGGGASPRYEDNGNDPLYDDPGYNPLGTDIPEDTLERRIDTGWRFSLGYNYTMGLNSATYLNQLTFESIFNLTDNWRLTYSTAYDFLNGDQVYQTFSIYRDLRSWEARLRFEERRGVITVWFLIDIKDLPDIRIEGRPTLY